MAIALIPLLRGKKKSVQPNIYDNFRTIEYRLEGKNYHLFVADNQEKWTAGLMYFRKLEGVDGMIFLFPSLEVRSFWNKNTYMDLDVYWLAGDEVLGKSKLPSIEKSKEIVVVDSPAPANKVIEIPMK